MRLVLRTYPCLYAAVDPRRFAPLANRRGSGGSPWGSCSRKRLGRERCAEGRGDLGVVGDPEDAAVRFVGEVEPGDMGDHADARCSDGEAAPVEGLRPASLWVLRLAVRLPKRARGVQKGRSALFAAKKTPPKRGLRTTDCPSAELAVAIRAVAVRAATVAITSGAHQEPPVGLPRIVQRSSTFLRQTLLLGRCLSTVSEGSLELISAQSAGAFPCLTDLRRCRRSLSFR